MHTPVSPPSLSLHSLIHSDPIILNYFTRSDPQFHNSYALTKQLIIDGIRYRIINQQNKSYCSPKHELMIINKSLSNFGNHNFKCVQYEEENKMKGRTNRFLSPQKKNLLTPKITESVPAQIQPVIIYGKPKVKPDEGYRCPYHDSECPQSPTETPLLIKQIHIEEYLNKQNEIQEGVRNQWEKQFERFEKKRNQQNSKYRVSYQSNRTVDLSKTVKSPNQHIHELNDDSEEEYLSTKNISKNQKNHPQSRIKELIDQDKKNKAMQKKLKDQEKRLDQMEQIFKKMNKIGPSNKKIGSKVLTSNEEIDYELSNSSVSGGQFEQIESKVLERIKKKQLEKRLEKGEQRESIEESSFEFT